MKELLIVNLAAIICILASALLILIKDKRNHDN
jgi:hypothetical protein